MTQVIIAGKSAPQGAILHENDFCDVDRLNELNERIMFTLHLHSDISTFFVQGAVGFMYRFGQRYTTR